MLTDGRTDGQTDGRTEWGIAIALSQIGWLGAKKYWRGREKIILLFAYDLIQQKKLLFFSPIGKTFITMTTNTLRILDNGISIYGAPGAAIGAGGATGEAAAGIDPIG